MSGKEQGFGAVASLHFCMSGGLIDLAEIEDKFRQIVATVPYYRGEKVWCRAEDVTRGGLQMSFAIQESVVLYFGFHHRSSYHSLPIGEIANYTAWVTAISAKFADSDFKSTPLLFVSGGIQLNGSAGSFAPKALESV